MEEKITNLIESNPHIFTDTFLNHPVDADKLSIAEKSLGLKFPEPYVWFLQRWGGIFGYTEISGCGENGEIFCINDTEKEQKMGLPINLIVIQDLGEYVHCIDTETGKVVSWSHHDNDGTIEMFPDFYSYLFDQLQELIDNF